METGTYVNGKEEGPFKKYYKNGVLQEQCRYKDGMLHGEYRYWDEKGTLLEHKNYDMGREVPE
jgi:antitoxin component YwqK of YwqJK toxin-antitoxin module